MRIIAISDTHGDFYHFEKIVSRHEKDGDCFLFLGDGYKDFEDISCLYPDKKMLSVRGNCDFGCLAKETDYFFADGIKIMFTHGHNYGVKLSNANLVEAARSRGAHIVLYGHTHKSLTDYRGGIYIMNPGSVGHSLLGKPTYGIVDITKAGIVTNIVTLPD